MCVTACLVTPHPYDHRLNFYFSYVSLDGPARGGVGLPAGIGPRSPPTTSLNRSRRSVVVTLTHVVTTASGMNTPPISLREFFVGTTSKPQSPPPQHLLCGGYPQPNMSILPLSGYRPSSRCNLTGVGGLILRQSSVTTLPTSIAAWVRS